MYRFQCRHCKRTGAGFGVTADGSVVCHTDDPARDCYRLITVYGHQSDGSCCAQLGEAATATNTPELAA